MYMYSKIINLYEQCIIFDKLKSLCFTGHRSQKLPWGFNENDIRCIQMKTKLKNKLESAIIEGYYIFYSGMALGFDMICVETLLELKKKYKQIIIIGVLPCESQACKWPEKEQNRYRKLLEQLDYIWCKNKEYIGRQCMIERNEYMVKHSSKMIALFNGQSGGTKLTIDYAKEQGLNIEIINP